MTRICLKRSLQALCARAFCLLRATVHIATGQAPRKFALTYSTVRRESGLLALSRPDTSKGLQRGTYTEADSLHSLLVAVDSNCVTTRRRCRPMDADLSYLGNCPRGFMADVVLAVNKKKLPAHSQFLASQSRLLEGLLQDTNSTFSKQTPLVISTPLEGYKESDVLTFLRHVYKDQPVQSEQEALSLLQIADQFDSPGLTEKAVMVLEAAQGNSLFSSRSSGKDVLDWLHVAERFNLSSFKIRCIRAVAQQFEVLQHDKRLLQLQPATAVELMQAIQQGLKEHKCEKTFNFQLSH